MWRLKTMCGVQEWLSIIIIIITASIIVLIIE